MKPRYSMLLYVIATIIINILIFVFADSSVRWWEMSPMSGLLVLVSFWLQFFTYAYLASRDEADLSFRSAWKRIGWIAVIVAVLLMLVIVFGHVSGLWASIFSSMWGGLGLALAAMLSMVAVVVAASAPLVHAALARFAPDVRARRMLFGSIVFAALLLLWSVVGAQLEIWEERLEHERFLMVTDPLPNASVTYALPQGARTHPDLALVDGAIAVGWNDGVVLLDEDSVRWSFELDPEGRGRLDIVAGSEEALVVKRSTGVYRLDEQSGRVVWNLTVPPRNSDAVIADLYVTDWYDTPNRTIAYNTTSGGIAWQVMGWKPYGPGLLTDGERVVRVTREGEILADYVPLVDHNGTTLIVNGGELRIEPPIGERAAWRERMYVSEAWGERTDRGAIVAEDRYIEGVRVFGIENGSIRWEYTNEDISRLNEFDVGGSFVYLTTYVRDVDDPRTRGGGTTVLYVLDGETGEQRAAYALGPGEVAMAVPDGFLIDYDGSLKRYSTSYGGPQV